MKKTIAILLITVMVLTFVACSAKSRLVGTWGDAHQSVTFKKDGSGTSFFVYVLPFRDYMHTMTCVCPAENEDADAETFDNMAEGFCPARAKRRPQKKERDFAKNA